MSPSAPSHDPLGIIIKTVGAFLLSYQFAKKCLETKSVVDDIAVIVALVFGVLLAIFYRQED